MLNRVNCLSKTQIPRANIIPELYFIVVVLTYIQHVSFSCGNMSQLLGILMASQSQAIGI